MSPLTSRDLEAPPAVIRTATPDDRAAIGDVIARAYGEYRHILSPELYATYLAELVDVADLDGRDGSAVGLVAELDGQVVGTVTFYPHAAAAVGVTWPNGWAGIRALAVDPANRSKGVARRLVEACIDRATAGGAPAVALHTAGFMTAAVRLYEQCGFERVPAFDIDADDMMGVVDPTAPRVIAYLLRLGPTPEPYFLGRSASETRRLVLQHQVYAPITRQLLTSAGLTRGMKVLDLGSGAGDVALLVADVVGPQGRVVGVDMNADILATARSRTESAGWTNVEFRHGDIREIDLPADFDAVVGRWILMYVPDPADLLRHVQSRLQPGGIVAFLESADLTTAVRAFPTTPHHELITRWMTPPADAPGPTVDMGLRLYRTFVDAGLSAPQLRCDAPIGGGPDWPGYALVAESIRSLLPFLEQIGAVTADEADVDTLEGRLRDEVVAVDGVQILPTVIGAWARRR